MKYKKQFKIGIIVESLVLLILISVSAWHEFSQTESISVTSDGFINWVDFNVSYEALCRAYELDISTYEEPVHLNWIELLSYAAAKCGGEFRAAALDDLETAAKKLTEEGMSMSELTKDLSCYDYYLEAYTAILAEYVGEYEIETKEVDGKPVYEKKYGLKCFSPIAKGFPYSDYDDFGVSRSYGYKRQHLGHDMMGQIGTPVVAVESGYVEVLGWNKYGGWRIGIRSYDKKRYYYYAHLRQNYPYSEWLKEGSEVTAGDIIGYMGHTGYSDTENVNNIKEVHLHFGIQLIFDESQKEGSAEIWIDGYNLTRFLRKNQSEAEKVEGTKDWTRIYDMKEIK